MTKALKALEELSEDPSVREIAEMRELAEINRHIIISQSQGGIGPKQLNDMEF